MTTTKSTNVRRISLFPPCPQGDRDPPNAFMVDASEVRNSLTVHPRQHDQEIVDHQKQLEEQRPSLITAQNTIENWNHKRNSTAELHEFHLNNHIKK